MPGKENNQSDKDEPRRRRRRSSSIQQPTQRHPHELIDLGEESSSDSSLSEVESSRRVDHYPLQNLHENDGLYLLGNKNALLDDELQSSRLLVVMATMN